MGVPSFCRTKIVCTLGPSTRSAEAIRELVAAGMNVARINFSHGTHEQHAQTIRLVREISQEADRPVAILGDLQGPRIRIGDLQTPIPLEPGTEITLAPESSGTPTGIIPVTYELLADDLKAGDRILVDDGLLDLTVVSVKKPRVTVRVVHGGPLRSHKGMNFPGVNVTAPSLTTKDRADVAFAVAQDIEYLALSFVRRARDVDGLRAMLPKGMLIIAKIEKDMALENIESIVEASDGVMVARGDLGVEIPVERVPAAQKYILARAGERGRLAITATEMLETMIERDVPTRAEVSDVANAVYDGTDVLMLSGETAIGHNPVAAVAAMHRIALAAESPLRPTRWTVQYDTARPFTSVLAGAAQKSATQVAARALVVVTGDGHSALLASKHRPGLPVFAVASRPAVWRRAALFWGVTPWRHSLRRPSDRLMLELEAALRDSGHVHAGDVVVYLRGSNVWGPVTDLVRLARVPRLPRTPARPARHARTSRARRTSR